MKPNCYECKYRDGIPGDAHSKCTHPDAGLSDDPFSNILAIFASVGRVAPLNTDNEKLGIKGNPHGIKNGWFNWPYNFDPVWLENCNGFKKREEVIANNENANDGQS